MLTKLKKACAIFLIFTLICGILSTAFGISVLARGRGSVRPITSESEAENESPEEEMLEEYVDPTDAYDDIKNEVALKDDVVVFTEEEAAEINNAIVSIDTKTTYSGTEYYAITLEGEDHNAFETVSYDDIIYLQGDENTPFGDDRILKIDTIQSYNNQTYIEAYEPYFEEAFDSLEICSSDYLTEDNLVKAYYAEGVSSHFGNIDEEMEGVPQQSALGPSEYHIAPVSTNPQYSINRTATEQRVEGGDLIVTFGIDLDDDDEDDDEDEDKDEDKEGGISAELGLEGKFGIKDLTAYIVCDMPRAADFEELYFGISGQTYVSITFNGGIRADAEPKATEKDTWLCKLEGLNNKRFPLAVFQFQGTSPVYITNAAFDKTKEAIIPSMYLIIYSDWEGHISVNLEAGFEYTHSFNNGLRVFEKGKPCLTFQDYPYERAYDVEDEDNLNWFVDVEIDAETDLTLMGGSVLFYVAGLNLAELSAARIGIQAKCNTHIKASTEDGLEFMEDDDSSLYLRGYLKILEAKVKLKAEGKTFLSGLSVDVDFEFALLDITLFEAGHRPDEFRPKVPVSSMKAPHEFESVMTIVCDVSGSMGDSIDSGQSKMDAAKEAAKLIVNETKKWADSYEGNYGVGVVTFTDDATTVAIPHIDYKFIEECIDCMVAEGGTSISSGIDSGVAQLESVEAINKVIVLMTDGQDNNDSDTLEAAQKAAESNIKIYTIGFGNDVKEAILQDVADTTGGEYKYAETDNIIGIISGFLYAQQATNAEVLADMQGTVGEGETSETATFEVDDKNGDLVVTTVWPGSFLDTILIDPNGREVDEEYPGSVTDESKIPSTITVKNPLPGEWSFKIKGIETSYEQEPFYTIVSFKDVEGTMVNGEMKSVEKVAAYCLPIGVFMVISSTSLLCCFIPTKRKKKEE